MDLTTALLDYGMSGIFLAFMVWNWFDAQKRSDKQIANFLASIDKLRTENDEKVSTLRERYDVMITDLNTERTTVRSNIAGQVAKLLTEMEGVKSEISKILVESVATGQGLKDTEIVLTKLTTSMNSLVESIKTMEKDMSQGLSMMNEIQQEQKLKEVARQVALEQSRKDI